MIPPRWDKEACKLNIVIPFDGRVRTIIRSSFVAAKRLTESHYGLTGDVFQMTDVTAEQVLILPDEVALAEGELLTDEALMRALPLESFISVSAEEALPNALGLLLRLAVADGRLTDAELLSIQPALEGRAWKPGLSVQVGDVYSYANALWRCIQAHTTQGNWPPDLAPALWRKVEIVSEDEARVWQAGVDYVVGDEVAYPDETSPLYVCQQAHTSQEGWEPPSVPALWKALDRTSETHELPQYEVESDA